MHLFFVEIVMVVIVLVIILLLDCIGVLIHQHAFDTFRKLSITVHWHSNRYF